jgi:hypothetical protein
VREQRPHRLGKPACPRGHPYPESLFRNPNGSRGCRECRKARSAQHYAAKRRPPSPLPNAAKTHCPKGHPYAGANLIVRTVGGRRACRACKREDARLRAERRRAKAGPKPSPVLNFGTRNGSRLNAWKVLCKRGHLYDEQNTYLAPNGSRSCRTCRAHAGAKSKHRKRQRLLPVVIPAPPVMALVVVE